MFKKLVAFLKHSPWIAHPVCMHPDVRVEFYSSRAVYSIWTHKWAGHRSGVRLRFVIHLQHPCMD